MISSYFEEISAAFELWLDVVKAAFGNCMVPHYTLISKYPVDC